MLKKRPEAFVIKKLKTRQPILCLALLALLIAFGSVNCEASVNASGGHNTKLVVDPINRSESCSAILYDNTNGLPTSEANAIAETEDGFIWIGGYGGLTRYDGNYFERLPSASGITSVSCLYVDSKGKLWVGTSESGIVRMDQGVHTTWDEEGDLPSNFVRAITEDAEGRLYVGTSAGLVVSDIEREHFMPVGNDLVDDDLIITLRAGADGLIYGLNSVGDAFTIENGNKVAYYRHDNYGLSRIACIMPDPENSGYVYIETDNALVYYGRLGDHVSEWTRIDIAPLSQVAAFEYIQGEIWICALNGIGVLNETGFHRLDNFPMDNNVTCVMTDYEGNLWFGSTRQGVMKIAPNRFDDTNKRYDLTTGVVNSTCFYNGKLFIATDEGLKCVDNNGIVSELPLIRAETVSGFDLNETDLLEWLDGGRIRSIIRDSKDRLWISTWRTAGLLRYDKGVVTAFTASDGLFTDKIRTVYERQDGSILVVDNGGICVIEGDSVTARYSGEHASSTVFLSVTEGPNGDILAGTDGAGIYIFSDDGVRHIGTSDGLTSGAVMRIKRDHKRDIYWVITGTSIAYLTEDYQLTTLKNFPYSNNFDIYQNSQDIAWILSSNGLYALPTDDLLSDSEETVPMYYGMANGLPCIATANSYSYLSDNGDLYMSGTTGVAKTNIEESRLNTSDLKLSVPFIYADGERYYPNEDGRYVISSNVKKLTVYPCVFNYSLINPQVTYYLGGFDEKSTTVRRNDLTMLDYTNLRGGTYRFNMMISDSLGTSRDYSVEIIKQKALYEQGWFYLVIGLLAALAIAAGVRWYVRKTVKELEKKHREEAEKEKYLNELHMARRIQESMLPHNFPPFPDRPEFDLYASMDPALEVGGDFYDFFLIDDDHLGLVMADVSGKGIPAALFMMVSKTILQSCAMLGRAPAEILEKTNEALSSNNQIEMFVTVWLGILEISTGKITAANAGHEYPAIMQDGQFKLMKDKHGFIIGAIEGTVYREYEFTLKSGDRLFLYTDGVPEATDSENHMFGTDRMIETLNTVRDEEPEQVLKAVRRAVDDFVKDAEQFDDLTMMCLKYN